MTPEEIQAMAKGLAQGQAVWYVLSACIGGAFAFLGAYGAEKAKNHATKQDIGEITKAVKAVEAGFNEKLADLQAHHQLRMVAAERRMQAHQEAYAHWLKLYNFLAGVAVTPEYFDECKTWYTNNCIFLGAGSREYFAIAILVAEDANRAREVNGEHPDDLDQGVMRRAGETILQEVELPVLSVEAQKKIAKAVAPV